MAQETDEGNQSKKRKKWIENLSVFSSEEEENFYKTTNHVEEKQNILSSNKAIYLRFPYYMGSDNSDDEEGLKYFPNISPKKEIQKSDSSSDEVLDDKVSYKHTKRKHKENSTHKKQNGRKTFVGNVKSKKYKSTRTSSEESDCSHSKSHTSSKKLKGTLQEVPKKISPNCRRKRSCRAKTRLKLSDEEENVYVEKEKAIVSNHSSNKFLDSSSENSDTINSRTAPKHTKYRRINVLPSSSSSSSDSELKEIDTPQNNTKSAGDIKPLPQNKTDIELKPAACLSSEDEDRINQIIKLQKGETTVPPVSNNNAKMSIASDVSSNIQKKITNPKAWRNIGVSISDIKAQFNKQSKVEELKKKLMSPNAPSVAVYRKIQEREILKNKSGLQRHISTRKPYNDQAVLPYNEKTVINFNDGPSTVTSQCRSQHTSMVQENSFTKQFKSTVSTVVTSEMSNSLPEDVDNLIVPTFETMPSFDSSQNNSTATKKIRHAHNRQKSTSDVNNVNPVMKIQNQCIKKQLSKDNKPVELKQSQFETSKSFDVLGNIMSQMDNNPFKIQKPSNKKNEPTPEMLGWFPAGTNTSPLFGQTQNACGLQQTRVGELPLKHTAEISTPRINETNLPNPNFNPLYSTMLNSSINMQQEISRKSNFQHKKQGNFKISENKPKEMTNIQEFATATISPSQPSSDRTIIPFYSAPNEDYESIGNLSKNKIVAMKSSTSKPNCEAKTDCVSGSSNKSRPMDREKCNEKSLGSGSQALKESKVSGVLHNNNLSKDRSPQISSSRSPIFKDNSVLPNINKLIAAENSSESKNFVEKARKSSTSGIFGGSKVDMKDSGESESKSISNNSSKGIRVRFGGTEFRLTKNTDELTDGGSSKGLSSKIDLAAQSSVGKCLNVVTQEVSEHKKITKKIVEESFKPMSSSSSTSSSSSSTDDSSSENSDDSSNDSDGKSSGFIKETAIMSEPKQSFLMESDQTRDNSVKENNSVAGKNSITIEPNENPLSYFETKHSVTKSKIANDDEVILLSSSSDSDTTLQTAFDDSGVVSNNTEQPNKIDNIGEINNSKTSENVKCNPVTNKVGQIRVKSWRELSGTTDDFENKNSLESIQAVKDLLTYEKEQEKDPLETQTSNQKEKCILQVVTNNNLRQSSSDPKKVTDELNSSNGPQGKIAFPTIFLPVVPIAVLKPANSAKVKPLVYSCDQGKGTTSNLNTRCGSSFIVNTSHLLPTSSGGCKIGSNVESQTSTRTEAMPFPSENVESTFFNLCDDLFTDVVLFKIPKLADDLHLLIAYDIMKEERLKKIDQLISPETIISEKRRAEKEYADMIKIRGQSFVPLFMTIVNRIENINLKASLTAVYCKIVHQLENIDPVNKLYRFKIRNIIKSMLHKHSNGVSQEILSYFDTESDQSFFINFGFVEKLLVKYDNYVQEKQKSKDEEGVGQVSQLITETSNTSNTSERTSDLSLNSPSSESPRQSFCRLNHNLNQNSKIPDKPPTIGNLDQLLLKKIVPKK